MSWDVEMRGELAAWLEDACSTSLRKEIAHIYDAIKICRHPKDIAAGVNRAGYVCFSLSGGYFLQCKIDERMHTCLMVALTR